MTVQEDTRIRPHKASPPEESPADTPQGRIEMRARRRKRARRRLIRRLLVLVLVTALTLVVWKNWDTLAPDKLLVELQEAMNGRSGDGYPLDISGTGVSVLTQSQGYAVTLNDSYLTYLNDNAGESEKRACTFSAPVLRTAGKYLVLAEQGGTRVQLHTRAMLLAEITAAQKVLSVAVNEKGEVAVLTEGPQGYASQVTVYNRRGETLYTRTRGQLATEVTLSPDGSTVALVSIQANGGSLDSTVEVFSLSSQEAAAEYSYTAQNVLLYRMEFTASDCLMAVGDEQALVMNPKKSTQTAYTLDNRRVLGYAAGADRLALALRPYGATSDGEIVMLDDTGTVKYTTPFTGEFRHLSVSGSRFLLLTGSYAQEFSHNAAGATVEIAADGQQAILDGSRVIVLGLSTLQAYTLS